MKKRIIKNIAILILPFLLLFFVLNELYKHSDNYKCKDGLYYIHTMQENNDIACIGNSHIKEGLRFDLFSNYRSVNMALAGQSYLYSEALLKQYCNNFSPNALVFIPIDFFHVRGIQLEEYKEKQRYFYYRVLDKKHLQNWKMQEYLRYTSFPLLRYPNGITHIGRKEKPEINKTKTTEYYVQCRLFPRYRHIFYEYAPDEGEKGLQFNFDIISRITDFCLSKGFRPVFITTPITKQLVGYFNLLKPGYTKDFYTLADRLKEKYPDILYLDYLQDSKFTDNFETYFHDTDHLNVYGAEAFTKRVIADLKQAGYLEDF